MTSQCPVLVDWLSFARVGNIHLTWWLTVYQRKERPNRMLIKLRAINKRKYSLGHTGSVYESR